MQVNSVGFRCFQTRVKSYTRFERTFGISLDNYKSLRSMDSGNPKALQNRFLKSLENFARNHLCRSPFYMRLIEKKASVQVFSCEFREIFKNTFFTEHLRSTASGRWFVILLVSRVSYLKKKSFCIFC